VIGCPFAAQLMYDVRAVFYPGVIIFYPSTEYSLYSYKLSQLFLLLLICIVFFCVYEIILCWV